MKFLGHLLASLLSAALSSTVLIVILGATLGSSAFILGAATQTKFYDQLAAQLPARLAAEDGAAKAAFTQAISPSFIRQQSEALVPQLLAHYGQGGPAPSLSLSGLRPRLEAAGYPVDADLAAMLDKPQTISAGPADTRLMELTTGYHQYKWAAPIAALILAAIILLVARRRRWSLLMRAAIGSAITIAVFGGLMLLLPGLIVSSAGGATLQAYLPVVIVLVKYICGEMARLLFWAAGGLVGVAILLWCVQSFSWLRTKFARPPKPAPPTDPSGTSGSAGSSGASTGNGAST